MDKENKQRGKQVWIRKRNPDTGNLEDVACWVDGKDIFAIEKEDPATGEWKRVVREVPEPSEE